MISVQNPPRLLNGSKATIKLTIQCFLIFIFSTSIAQKIDCDKNPTHLVEKSQTIYGISKQYNITQDDLMFCNPELKDGLKVGARIKIPVRTNEKVLDEKQQPTTPPANFKIHIVKSKETLYGITKKYNVGADDLKLFNPEVEQGLKVGMELKIPLKASKGAATIEAAEQIADGVKEESTQIETKVYSKPCKTVGEKDRSTIYKIALILPFYANSTDSHNPKSKIGIDFYQGVKYALDSLKKNGLYAKLYVFDSHNDSTVVKSMLKKGSLEEMDLIIGPLFSALYMPVAEYAKKNKIPIVAPFVQSDITIRNNEYSFKASPDNLILAQSTANYIQKKFSNHKILFLTNSNERDEEYAAQLKAAFSDNNIQFKIINYTSFSEVATNLSETGDNLIIFPSSAQAQVYDFTNKLNAHRSKKITLFGLAEWCNFENIEFDYLNNLNFHYAASSLADFNSKASQSFQSAFREEYKTEVSVFALQGFDIAWYFMQNLYMYGKNFTACVENQPTYQGLNGSLRFYKKNKTSGFENRAVNIIKIQDLTAQIVNRYE